MKILATKVEQFIKSIDTDIRAVLVYGTDYGLVRERTNRLISLFSSDPLDPFNIVEITREKLSKDELFLLDEVLAISFNGERRIIHVREANDDITKSVSAVLEDNNANDPMAGFLLVEAGNLGPRSSLRSLFEKSEQFAALPCYPDNEKNLESLVLDMVKADEKSIESTALKLAISLLGTDRQINRTEIGKLVLFAGSSTLITEEMVLQCLGDNSESSSEAAVFAAANGDYKNLSLHLQKVWADGIEPISVIRHAQRHFQRLHFVLVQLKNGVEIDSALKQLKPPIFWRVSRSFRSQLEFFSLSAIQSCLIKLTDAELAAKSTAMPAILACDRALISVAQISRNEKDHRYQ